MPLEAQSKGPLLPSFCCCLCSAFVLGHMPKHPFPQLLFQLLELVLSLLLLLALQLALHHPPYLHLPPRFQVTPQARILQSLYGLQ